MPIIADGRRTHRVDAAHTDVAGPHGHAPEWKQASLRSKGRWFSGIGQGLAYLGVLGLTAGTSLVVVSYFGGPARYAPTGWLVSTVGQMLLFLGVVTLVSNGMEQTSSAVQQAVDERVEEVSRKLDRIGQRIVRIEKGSRGPRRPHIADRVAKRPDSAAVVESRNDSAT